MTTATLESSIDSLRDAVAARMAATPADDPQMAGYKPPILAGCTPAEECAAEVLRRAASCGDGQRMRGDSLMKSEVHPTSQAYFDLLDEMRQLHLSKSAGYGCPDGTDPLLNIRNGALFVGIPPWQAAMVRLSDKVTRLATFNKTGRLSHESVEDNLMDLASYALLALVLYREDLAK
jgi:hypothetical protein